MSELDGGRHRRWHAHGGRPRAIRDRGLTPGGQQPRVAILLAGALSALSMVGGAHANGVRLRAPHPYPPVPLVGGRASAAVDRTLTRMPFVVQGGRRRRDVALTFDDGPSAFTPKIASILRRAHAGATFFEIGEEFAHFPPYSRLLGTDGFPVGDHTLTHPLLAHHASGDQHREIAIPAYELAAHGVPFPRLFRPPYGSFDSATFNVLARLRMLMVLWSSDSLDYATPGVQAIVHNALAGVHPGSIILMHDGGGNRSETVRALPLIIHALRARGYHLVTVPRMLTEDPPAGHQRVPDGMGPAATAS